MASMGWKGLIKSHGFMSEQEGHKSTFIIVSFYSSLMIGFEVDTESFNKISSPRRADSHLKQLTQTLCYKDN